MSSAQSANNNASLSQLAKSLMDEDMSPDVSPRASPKMSPYAHGHAQEQSCASGWWAFIFYFLVFALVFYFLYFALRPSFVLNQCHDSHSSHGSEEHDEEINNGKLLGAAIVSALILIFVLWLFYWCFQSL
jgi:hypothetical protein